MKDNKLRTIVCNSLDKDVESLSANIQAKLTCARIHALEQKKNKYFWSELLSPRLAVTFASLSFAAIAAVMVLQEPDTNKIPPVASNTPVAENLIKNEPDVAEEVDNTDVGDEFFLTEEDLDFFENLDLYQWLDSEFKIS